MRVIPNPFIKPSTKSAVGQICLTIKLADNKNKPIAIPRESEAGFIFKSFAIKIVILNYNTCSLYNFSSVLAGSSHNPGCTFEVCTTVLGCVAVSHLKREGISSLAIALSIFTTAAYFGKGVQVRF